MLVTLSLRSLSLFLSLFLSLSLSLSISGSLSRSHSLSQWLSLHVSSFSSLFDSRSHLQHTHTPLNDDIAERRRPQRRLRGQTPKSSDNKTRRHFENTSISTFHHKFVLKNKTKIHSFTPKKMCRCIVGRPIHASKIQCPENVPRVIFCQPN